MATGGTDREGLSAAEWDAELQSVIDDYGFSPGVNWLLTVSTEYAAVGGKSGNAFSSLSLLPTVDFFAGQQPQAVSILTKR